MASIDPGAIQHHMTMVDSEGTTIGKVDHMQDGKIKLTKNDSPDHQHHMVPLDWVRSVDDVVTLNKTLAEIKETTGGLKPADAVPTVGGATDAVPNPS